VADDPLADLVRAGGPTLEWTLRHALDGRGTLPDAWLACDDAGVLMAMLRLPGRNTEANVLRFSTMACGRGRSCRPIASPRTRGAIPRWWPRFGALSRRGRCSPL
jgi:hypothetical protein